MPCVLLSKYFSHSHSNPILILRFHHVDHLPGSGEIHHCVPSLLQVQTHVSSKSTKCMRRSICKSSLYYLQKSTNMFVGGRQSTTSSPCSSYQFVTTLADSMSSRCGVTQLQVKQTFYHILLPSFL